MVIVEDAEFSLDYLDPAKRSVANSVQILFKDGSQSEKVTVEYPMGHRRRRREALPLLQDKARRAFSGHFGEDKADGLMALFSDRARLEGLPCHAFVSEFVK
jgi:2-methylcitrate dehydratase